MATILVKDLARIRRKITKNLQTSSSHPGYIKQEINNAIQALEDWYETNSGSLTGAGKSQGSSAINSATTFPFTNAQKKIIGAYWFEYKFAKELE